jgi:hypothetical protein
VTTARDELYAYATVAFRDYEVPEVVDRHVTRLIDAYRAEVLAEAAAKAEQHVKAQGHCAGCDMALVITDEIRRLAQPDTEEQP